MIKRLKTTTTVVAGSLLLLIAAAFQANAAADGGSYTSLAESGSAVQTAETPTASLPAAPTATPNGLLTFTSQSEFESAFPGLPKEDFEESPIGAGDVLDFPEPLDSSTNVPGAFGPGDIQAGLTIQTVEEVNPTDGLIIIGNGFFGNTSKAVGINYSADTMNILFSDNDVYAAGMDLLLHSLAASVTISIYGSGGILLDTLTPTIQTTETFFGVYSNQPITHITVASASQAEIVDNIQFGWFPPQLTFYTDQAAFEGAHSGLPVEDFEESGIPDTGGSNFTSPLDSTTNQPPSFVPGDILPDLAIQPVNNPTPDDMFVVGGNFILTENTSKAVGSVDTHRDLSISFTNNTTYAVGMDLMFASAPGDATIVVSGPNGRLLGTTTRTIQRTETFFGVYSNQPITKIKVRSNSNVDIVDNIQFGGSLRSITFYDDQASFEKVKPHLLVEDFEESPVAPGAVQSCTPPINSATDEAGCLSPGDILPGISFQPLVPCSDCGMVILGDGFFGASTNIVGPNSFTENLEMVFAQKNIRYFGADVTVLGGTTPADMLFSMYDSQDNLIGSALRNIGPTPAFFGVISSNHISRITVTNPGGSGELVDNVQFGAFPWLMYRAGMSSHPIP